MSFPQLEIVGNTYPVPYMNQLFANFCTMLSYGNIAYMFFGETIMSKFGITEPTFLHNFREQKLFVIAVHFALNMVSSKLISSGAFEVIYNDQILHSKIETGTVPTTEEIVYKLSRLIAATKTISSSVTEDKVSTTTGVSPPTYAPVPGSEEFSFDNIM
jgi:selT/selW/selH-like putative selenoprotein